jgi:RNA 2',3'-cyclic 3'-phosphodiesterase
MARIRTFIAVDIGEAVRQKVVALQERLARTTNDVKWVEPSNLHITLHFLGEVDQIDLVPICRIVKEQAQALPPFTLELTGLGAFPTPRRPKILWAGIADGADDLKRLHGLLEAPLLELGCYRREDRAYSPHLTLGRLADEDRNGAWASILTKHADWHGGAATVDEVLVMSSELGRDGPIYSVMGRGKLAGRDD